MRVDSTAERLSTAQWAAYENVGLTPSNDVESLTLNWINQRVTDLDVYGAMTAVQIEQTIEGAPSLSVTLRDPDMALLSNIAGRTVERARGVDPVAVDDGWEALNAPSIIGRAVDVTLDGVTFRLTGVSYSTQTAEATLTFEHRLAYWLRHKRGARRASRNACTRAQFVLALVREVRARRYRFVCPELNVVQPRLRAGTRGLRDALGLTSTKSKSTTVDTSSTERGFARKASITVKGKLATNEQRRNLEIAMREADRLSTSVKPRKALVLAMIEESACVNLSSGDRDSAGVLQVRASTARGIAGLKTRDVAAVCREFLVHGYWKHRPKGANDLAKAHPEWSASQIAQACQGSAGSRYAKWDDDADAIVKAWSGDGTAAGGTYTKSYQFARNADEDSWTAIQRLALEVGWRFFIVGNSVYYMSEPDLYARRPRYSIEPDDPAVLDLSYEMDWGKPVSEATLQVVLDQWGAPPGCVVVIDKYGPADGRWLVTSVRRDYFSPIAEVTLRQPGPSKREPAPEKASRPTDDASATSGDASKSARLYDEAKRISDAHGPYDFGGGHGPPLSTLKSAQGLDCSSSCSLALKRAGLFSDNVAWVSGKFATSYGKAGTGQHFTVWANGSHVWIEFHGLGSGKRFDTSPYGSGDRGPRLRSKQRPTGGFTPRHWPGC